MSQNGKYLIRKILGGIFAAKVFIALPQNQRRNQFVPEIDELFATHLVYNMFHPVLK